MCARSKIHAFNFMDTPEWLRTLWKCYERNTDLNTGNGTSKKEVERRWRKWGMIEIVSENKANSCGGDYIHYDRCQKKGRRKF